MGSSVLPEIEVLLESLDRQMVQVIPALQQLDEKEKLQQSVALSLGLALRLCTFGLGPAGQLDPSQIELTALAFLETLNDLQEDLLRGRNH